MAEVQLEWRDLTVDTTTGSKTTTKRLLDGVSGVARPGQLVAIMGPSGAGKSVLLDCLANYQTLSMQGEVLVNEQPWTKSSFRRMSYIVQKDLFYETITVEEHLTFQAKLRLGSSLTQDQLSKRVHSVMTNLGLTKCRNALIGGGTQVRGISGGERKRLSLATEMLTDPTLLLVDEPTSGLDSHMALAIVQLLRRLAHDQHRTVITTIHQPSPDVFACFDHLHLLTQGTTVYDGPAAEVVHYLESINFKCPDFTSASDFFMRLLTSDSSDDDDERIARLKHEWRSRAHHQVDQLNDGGEIQLNQSAECAQAQPTTSHQTRLGVAGQLVVLVHRSFTRLIRDRTAFRAALFQSLFISLLVGSVYYQLDVDQSGIQNIAGVLFFVSINQALISCKPAFSAITSELPLLQREYRAGLFNLIAWYTAKNVSEIVLQLILPVVYFLPQYLLIFGFHHLVRYLSLQLIVSLLSSAAVGFGYSVSCVFDRSDIASIVGVALLLPFILFGGLFLNAEDAPGYLIWLQYLSPVKYCFEALMKIVWRPVDSVPCEITHESCVATSGAGVLQLYGISGARTPEVDGALLVGLNVGFRLFGLVVLWCKLKLRK